MAAITHAAETPRFVWHGGDAEQQQAVGDPAEQVRDGWIAGSAEVGARQGASPAPATGHVP